MSEASPTGPVRLALAERLRLRWLARNLGPAVLLTPHEPRFHGITAQGVQMLAAQTSGQLPFAAQSSPEQEALHGFGWLDDIAALGDRAARAFAQRALDDWITRFGLGNGPGWTPDLLGRRIARWLGHGQFLLQGMQPAAQMQFLQSLALQVAYLERSASRAEPGLPVIEAQLGRLYAALSLEGMAGQVPDIRAALLRAGQTALAADGTIPSRNPEHLLELFSLLCLAAQAVKDAGLVPERELIALLDKMARALRILRHADGGLVRYHGGGRGREGALGAALAMLARLGGAAPQPPADMAMGYGRLAAGRTTVLIDAAAPPKGAAAARAHASALAFEMTSNRRPLIVSCGDGREFGLDWYRASRATASHSTLALEGYSSARFATGRGAQLELVQGPRNVGAELRKFPHARTASLRHDGYVPSHGLEHLRHLDLSADGRALSGEDMLIATTKAERRRCDEALARSGGVAFALRFHLHPDARAMLDAQGAGIQIVLPSGEVWAFHAPGHAPQLAPSVYLEKGRANLRESQQIVLSLRATGYTTQINWSLAMTEDMPRALRDIAPDNPLAADWPQDMNQG